MASIDQEDLRRAQAEQRIRHYEEASGSMGKWLLGLVGVIAIICVVALLGTGEGTEAAAPVADPVAVEDTAPITPVE